MTKRAYISKNFSPRSLKIIMQANDIINEYMDDGLTLTLRQLYYQFVSKDLIANKQSEYKRLGSIINDARLAGLIDWEAIEDRTRNLVTRTHWTDPGHIMGAVVGNFKMDHWQGQEYRPEVWIEKEALVGVIASVCRSLDVPYFACKGYVSQSEMWGASQRFIDRENEEQTSVIIHLGDHDPSGIDMTRDIEERQQQFEAYDCVVERIALNMDQIEDYGPPPNPAKITDSRASGYIKKFGRNSWELDALNPRTLRDLISRKILQYRDEDIYNKVIQQEEEYVRILEHIEENWETLKIE